MRDAAPAGGPPGAPAQARWRLVARPRAGTVGRSPSSCDVPVANLQGVRTQQEQVGILDRRVDQLRAAGWVTDMVEPSRSETPSRERSGIAAVGLPAPALRNGHQVGDGAGEV